MHISGTRGRWVNIPIERPKVSSELLAVPYYSEDFVLFTNQWFLANRIFIDVILFYSNKM